MSIVFAPSCSLLIYKPELAKKTLDFLNTGNEKIDMLTTCCKKVHEMKPGTQVINICPGCDRRYSTMYQGVTTISFWEYIAFSDDFKFPDYRGEQMSIHDACPTRKKRPLQVALRTIAERMNIEIIESEFSMEKSICCGDSYFEMTSVEETKEQMKKRANQMPCDNVLVHCISCMKAFYIGKKQPRFLLDLLFEEETAIGTYEPSSWHNILDTFSRNH
ncbi:MAG: (Fe-S)-binding protein [Eubacteriales bacterium]